MMRTALLLAVALTPILPPRVSAGQQSADSSSVPPLISSHQLEVAGVASGATLVLMRFDRRLQAQFQGHRLQSDDELHTTAKQFSFLGGPGPFLIGGGLVALGSATSAHGLAAAGSRITGSVLLAASITGLGKGFFGRAVPTAHTRYQFSFGRGFHDRNGPFVSFPSGHTAAAFALASAMAAEAKRSRKPWSRFVTPLSYALASGVAIARVYQDAHWASDLPLAAVIGIWSGSTVESRFGSSGKASFVPQGTEVSAVPVGRRVILSAAIPF